VNANHLTKDELKGFQVEITPTQPSLFGSIR
jgi:hypothetical protein